MAKLSCLERQAIAKMVQGGFTFCGDSFFPSFASARHCMASLVRRGYAAASPDAFGDAYKPTDAARDFVTYGIEAEEAMQREVGHG
ncbi:hypothetical protein [Antarcticirhabdus aurantiaca]|uniref:Uncharacterized protein n=1 Tax=Antarcticirhabdus aurantiaca TaxID=2606717 RepID=A0ACD4NKW4_9HYPH|nr:hypothetical protein [Antarcticirhabdus aurantiaca]WAJ27513.1 hypothetical protein OXU80_22130 [Jeongeuplla avenae]